MMKTMKIYAVAALLATTLPAAIAQTSSPISVSCNDFVQKGDSLYIDAVFKVQSYLIESRKSLTLTPVIESPSQGEGLPAVLLNGKNRQKVYNREVKLHNMKDGPYYTVIKAYDAPSHTIHYKKAVGWEPWMKDARLILAQNLCGCGDEELVAPLLVANKVRMRPDQRYQVEATLVYITPEAETVKHRAETGSAYLDFEVGKSKILPDFRNNTEELSKIDQTISMVVNDKNITLEGLTLKGYASPEGSYKFNTELAGSRVKALSEYIRQRHAFKPDLFTLENGSEDWDGLRVKVEADASVPSRDKVLAIINSGDDPDRKDAKLSALDGGAPFRYLLIYIYPSLRRSDYHINYQVREFTVEEGREIIKIRPQQLSLSEMFAVANSYEIGSKEYNNVFDIAVRMYSSDPVANLNAANIALAKGDLAAARNYLAKAGNSPEAIHARGVLSLLSRDLTQAKILLEQAQAAGIQAAGANLDELEKIMEDNALFDSFNVQ